jgi:dTDP-4-dehydrorhamnose reductase
MKLFGINKMKRILILGSKGMAGHVIREYLKENGNYEVADLARGKDHFLPTYQIDISDIKLVTQTINDYKPNFVINCIGILNKDAEENPDKAIYINSYLPHFLAKMGKENKFKLIQISTDCVFSGKMGNYAEDSFKDGLGFYAQSKALGEVSYGNHITIRTSIIGPEIKEGGIGLFDWFMKQHGEIKGYTRAFWTGVTTIELARAIEAIIDCNISGVIHLVNETKISKYDLLLLLKKEFNKNDIVILPNQDYTVDKSLLKSKYLDFYTVPPYEIMLHEMYKWIVDHPQYYSKYLKGKSVK